MRVLLVLLLTCFLAWIPADAFVVRSMQRAGAQVGTLRLPALLAINKEKKGARLLKPRSDSKVPYDYRGTEVDKTKSVRIPHRAPPLRLA
jgi:hypothetical protein